MSDIHFEYLEKKESVFILGMLKHIECYNCPSFHMGCEGNYPQAQLVNMNPKEYLYNQKKGTETFLCGKLRNILIAEDIKLIEVEKTFDSMMKHNIAYLNKLVDKCIVRTGDYDLEIKSVEYALQKKLDAIIEENGKYIAMLQSLLADKEKLLIEKEKELLSERAKKNQESQYVEKMHDTIASLQRTVFEQKKLITNEDKVQEKLN
jgi:hypothetical protein